MDTGSGLDFVPRMDDWEAAQERIRKLEHCAAYGGARAEQVFRQIAYLMDAWDMTWEMLQTAREQGNLE